MADSLLIVSSAARVDRELAVAFGALPPALLPVDDRPLVVAQLARLTGAPAARYLALPEDFSPEAWQTHLLDAVGLGIVPVAAGLGPGLGLASTLEATAAGDTATYVLCGARLLEGVPLGEPDVVEGPLGARTGLPAYLSLSAPLLFAAALRAAEGDLERAVRAYRQERPLRPLAGARSYDFGDGQGFHRSRRSFFSARAFNTVAARGDRVVKSGRNTAKIAAESRWYAEVPDEVRAFCPRLVRAHEEGSGERGYEVEYLPLPTLGDMFVYGDTPPKAWIAVAAACADFLAVCRRHPCPEAAFPFDLYLSKTLARLEAASRARSWPLTAGWTLNGARLPSLLDLAEAAAARVRDAGVAERTLMHGDFCFANILYDAPRAAVRVIDPRGFVREGEPTVFGDPLYDLAKLYHSALGLYDLVIAGAYRCAIVGTAVDLEIFATPRQRAIGEIFRQRMFGGEGPGEGVVASAAALLFMSMIPLHADAPARQDAFLANALRLSASPVVGVAW